MGGGKGADVVQGPEEHVLQLEEPRHRLPETLALTPSTHTVTVTISISIRLAGARDEYLGT